MKANSFINILKNHLWISTFIAFLVGILLGSGSLWQYLGLKIAEKEYVLSELKHENTLRQQLLSLQANILNEIKDYIEIRDKFFNIESALAENYYDYQNKYSQSKSRLIKLVNEYNVIEGKLSILEERRPVFFNINAIIPPLRPKLVKSENNGILAIEVNQAFDEVEKAVNDHLKKLIEEHNQKISHK